MTDSKNEQGTVRVKTGLAEMFKGGVIMDVVNAEQAKIAEDAGATSVMALERVPADIRAEGGVARMASIEIIQEIMKTVTIPVMAKVRIGHFAEAQLLQELGVDFVDESEVLTPADEAHHVDKHAFTVPFVCGARNLGEALRRIGEGAAMIRTKGEAGSGNIVEAVRHMRSVTSTMKRLTVLGDEELMHEAKAMGAPYELVRYVLRVLRSAACGIVGLEKWRVGTFCDNPVRAGSGTTDRRAAPAVARIAHSPRRHPGRDRGSHAPWGLPSRSTRSGCRASPR